MPFDQYYYCQTRSPDALLLALYACPYWPSRPPLADLRDFAGVWGFYLISAPCISVTWSFKNRPVRACTIWRLSLIRTPTDAVVAQWQSTPLVRVRSGVQSSLTAPSSSFCNLVPYRQDGQFIQEKGRILRHAPFKFTFRPKPYQASSAHSQGLVNAPSAFAMSASATPSDLPI